MMNERLLAVLLLGLLALSGCSGGGAPAAPATRPAGRPSASPAAAAPSPAPRAAVYINFSLLLRGLQAKQTGLPAGLDHAICVLSSGSGLLAAPIQVSVPMASFSSGTEVKATAVFTDIPPGDGYSLTVSLYDGQGFVLDIGQTGSLTLVSGSNPISVILTLTGGTAPSMQFFSGFLNSTSGSTTLVQGDTLLLKSGVIDSRGVVSSVELWLDGTDAARHKDGTLLHTWNAPDFATPYLWSTAGVFAETVMPAVPNHVLTFNIHDNLSPAPDNLISSTSFPLTVVPPAGIDVGIK